MTSLQMPVRLVLLSLALVIGSQALAEGSVEAGKTKSVTCAACHGADGHGVNPEWPSLAGQHPSYLVRQLAAFKSGARANALMSGQAMLLSEQDMEDLAAYYAAMPPREGVADPALVEAGQRLYRGGNKATGASACIACHGPQGRGNAPAAYPWISGQHAVYTAAQLRAYASAERRSDMNQMMRSIASRLSADEIQAVSSYVEGLR